MERLEKFRGRRGREIRVGVAPVRAPAVLEPIQTHHNQTVKDAGTMTILNHCVVAVYDSIAQARQAVMALESAAYPSDQISLVTHSVSDEVRHEEILQYGDESEDDAAKGASVGGVFGLLLGAPLLTIPGIGPMLVAGPLAAGLTGAIVGGLVGAIGGWGVHEDHVQQYQDQVTSGKLLVVANGDPEQTAAARHILLGTNAESVQLHAEESADAPEIVQS